MSRKTLIVAALAAVMASSSQAGVFADVPFTHWAYQAVEKLAAAGVLEGYPDGLYRGRQCMTRYEFAAAAARMYDWIQKTVGGCDPETCERILREQQALNNRVDTLTNDVRDLGGKLTTEVARLDARIDAIPTGTTTVTQPGAPAFDPTAILNRLTALENRVNAIPGPVAGDPQDVSWRARLDALDALVAEFRPELQALGADVDAMKADIAALQGRVTALEGRVNNHESRIANLERYKLYGDLGMTIGFDGAAKKDGTLDGDLRFESGEALLGISARAGLDVAINDTTAARMTLWYDSDDNRFHGRPGERMGFMSELGIDEAWVKTKGLGGKWIFGRQYGGQDWDTGEAKHALGLGTGYYTGAALNGGRVVYNLGKHIKFTGLAQADDSSNPTFLPVGSYAANIAGVARIDLGLPWLKDKAGNDGIRIGVMGVGHLPNTDAEVIPSNALGTWKQFNDGSRTEEVSMSVDLHVNLLKGLDIEYTNQFRQTNGSGPMADGNADANGQVLYGKLGILDSPTFKLNVAVGAVGPDYSLSHSIISNPYLPNYIGTAHQLFTRPVMLGTLANETTQGAPTQSWDANFSWKLGSRPLNIRWAGSLRNKDLFDWMVYGEIPVIQTGAGDLKLGVGYINANPGHPLGGNTVAANLSAGFRF
ncbi:MAG TPA: hypothetical protein DCZ72_04155 [Armatimonadetes bacterium]|nr:hypothetical protein [Armatimonadota bacterium]